MEVTESEIQYSSNGIISMLENLIIRKIDHFEKKIAIGDQIIEKLSYFFLYGENYDIYIMRVSFLFDNICVNMLIFKIIHIYIYYNKSKMVFHGACPPVYEHRKIRDGKNRSRKNVQGKKKNEVNKIFEIKNNNIRIIYIYFFKVK